MAAVGRAVQRRNRVPRARRGSRVPGVARLRTRRVRQLEVDVRLLQSRHAGQGADEVMRVRLFVASAVLALAIVGIGAAAPPPTLEAGTLTVGVAMPSEGFQVGVVKGSQVVYAQGFEIDLARALALRLGLGKSVFLQNRFDRLYSAGPKPFDLAIGEISITPSRRRTVAFSKPYMSVDQCRSDRRPSEVRPGRLRERADTRRLEQRWTSGRARASARRALHRSAGSASALERSRWSAPAAATS